MNGSEAMVRTLLNHGVSVCFANPGTSEMHFVSALDRLPQMRCVLGLFEGVVTGAADGYYRMARRPAATLLHLGSGLGNGIANLHNAKRAKSGIVNIIGEHAQDHIANDAPLTSDIQALARPVSHWVRSCASAITAPADTAAAVHAARGTPGRVASLILPANAAWEDCPAGEVHPQALRPAPTPAASVVDDIAKAMRSAGVSPQQTALLLGGRAMLGQAPRLAAQIAARVGCKLLAETKNARSQRGAGRVNIPQIPYPLGGALEALADIRLLILVDAVAPVAFFGYPDKPRFLTHPECRIETLATEDEDVEAALQALNDAVGGRPGELMHVSDGGAGLAWDSQARPNSQDMGRVLAALLPEDAIVVDEAITTGRQLQSGAAAGAPHDWLEITGGAIGYGLPCATGAAVASPGRKVVAIIGDGSAMYTLQSLWTMAREGLDVTVIICANRKYQILQGELSAMGGPPPAANATRMLSLDQPHLDWVKLAEGQGVSGIRVDRMDTFAKALAAGLACGGPNLIEVLI
jgi:acetolactate synthase-1/2/3 large subunit